MQRITAYCQCFHKTSNLNTCIRRVRSASTKMVTFRHLGKIIRQAFLAFPSSYVSAVTNENRAEEVVARCIDEFHLYSWPCRPTFHWGGVNKLFGPLNKFGPFISSRSWNMHRHMEFILFWGEGTVCTVVLNRNSKVARRGHFTHLSIPIYYALVAVSRETW